MMNVILRNELKIELSNKVYVFKSGDVVKLDLNQGFAFHKDCEYCFDLDKSEYYLIN